MPESLRSSGQFDQIEEIWRYPIKSMAGEKIPAANVTLRGWYSDRMFALVEQVTNRVATVRTWAASLLSYRAELVTEPETEGSPTVRITFPNGLTVTTADPDIHERFSVALRRNLTLMSNAPAGLLYEVPAGTSGGSTTKATEMRIAAGAPAGTFFDYGCVHLITSSTLDHLQADIREGGLTSADSGPT